MPAEVKYKSAEKVEESSSEDSSDESDSESSASSSIDESQTTPKPNGTNVQQKSTLLEKSSSAKNINTVTGGRNSSSSSSGESEDSDSDSASSSSSSSASSAAEAEGPPAKKQKVNGTSSQLHKQPSTAAPDLERVTPKSAYQPPPGFIATKIQLSESQANSLRELQSLDAYDVWHITAPASLPLDKVTSLTAQHLNGDDSAATIAHEGIDYGMTRASTKLDLTRVLVPSEHRTSYDLLDRSYGRSLSVRQVEKPLGAIAAEDLRDPSTLAAVTVMQPLNRPSQKQREGLRTRYHPPGFETNPTEDDLALAQIVIAADASDDITMADVEDVSADTHAQRRQRLDVVKPPATITHEEKEDEDSSEDVGTSSDDSDEEESDDSSSSSAEESAADSSNASSSDSDDTP